ncbi:MAG: hypothetical protein J6W54_12745 [Fibrobacter sp.]|jgi:hypothetical protein|uniref:hypothetical protein n=1 Tax=Fibrobacter sp. TaxID=35828 RepID=UPI001B06ADF7|nr:hypothetical protein [Fibrobacter sp.]MBO7061943.1 hypothetical protein [Fibrobacter sp.]
MNKKDVIKAFFAGVFSIFPAFSGLPDFRSVDPDKSSISSRKSNIPPVRVRIRPVIQDVGACFDDVGNKLRVSMKRLSAE